MYQKLLKVTKHFKSTCFTCQRTFMHMQNTMLQVIVSKVCGRIVSNSNSTNCFGHPIVLEVISFGQQLRFTKKLISKFQIRIEMQRFQEDEVGILIILKQSHRTLTWFLHMNLEQIISFGVQVRSSTQLYYPGQV